MIAKFLKSQLMRLTSILSPKKGGLAVPIIIFQPGKVGSMSVQYSLEEAYKKMNAPTMIYHVHALNYLDEREEYVKTTRKNPVDSLRLIQEWRELRQDIEDHPQKKWNIINLVRDPVAIKVSALFQLLDQHIPDWQARLKAGNLTVAELDELFFSKKEFGFRGLNTWYDNQIKALWGIDVFAAPFPRDKGYQIYGKENINLMIIRLEDLNRVAEQAFDDFLGLKEFKVVNVNVGDEKPYAELYDQFKKRPLPENYVDEGYQTRFARHFYSADEIAGFRNRWIRK
jgi:hypothetical protein